MAFPDTDYRVRLVAVRPLELLLLLDVLLPEEAEDLLDELRLDEAEELDRIRLLELVLRETPD